MQKKNFLLTMRVVIIFTVGIALAALFGCETAPETNRPQLALIKEESLRKLGLKIFREIKGSARLSADGRIMNSLLNVGWRVTDSTHQSDFVWDFALIENASPNAFCLPGGKVVINTGVIPLAENEAGLAAVIGHEVGHVVARHGAERMSHSLLVGVLGDLIETGLSKDQSLQKIFRMAYGVGVTRGVTLPFSREHELEADRLGMIYMARAGYDPNEAIKFWERFGQWGGDEIAKNEGPQYLSTHPTGKERILSLQKFVPKAMTIYRAAPIDLGAGKRLF